MLVTDPALVCMHYRDQGFRERLDPGGPPLVKMLLLLQQAFVNGTNELRFPYAGVHCINVNLMTTTN